MRRMRSNNLEIRIAGDNRSPQSICWWRKPVHHLLLLSTYSFFCFFCFLVFPSLPSFLTEYIWLLLLVPFHWRGIARIVVEVPWMNLYETGKNKTKMKNSFLPACCSISSSRYVSKAPNMHQHKNALKWQCISNLGGIILLWSHGFTKNKCALLFW